MYFAGLSTNFCNSMVTISAFVENAKKYFYTWCFMFWVSYSCMNIMYRLVVCSRNRFLIFVVSLLHKNISRQKITEMNNVYIFCCEFLLFAENSGYVCPNYWIFDTLLNGMDVIVIINRKLRSTFIWLFPFCWWRSKPVTYNQLTVFVELCHSSICYAGVLHSNDVIFVVKVQVQIVLFFVWENQLML